MIEDAVYERNLMGSYMKLSAEEAEIFDEKMLLRKKIPGLLSMEKCYVDGRGQYWYDISGKQSLDTYCQIQSIGIGFVERMIESICSQIEILDRNLIHTDCLLLEADRIFITNQNQEIVFAAYPQKQETVSVKFQQLMEYLLTKIDHKDQEAVQMAYRLYEKTLDEGYDIMDVRNSVLESRRSSVPKQEELSTQADGWNETQTAEERTRTSVPNAPVQRSCKQEPRVRERTADPSAAAGKLQELYGRMQKIWEDWRNTLKQLLSKRKPELPEVVYPEEELAEEVKPPSHPTICLSDYRPHPEGLLLYEGYENFQDIRLPLTVSMIGKGEGVDIEIEKDTVSHYHAQINCQEQEYYIEDLNSTNGTYVNEELLSYKEKRQLKSNDIIRFADVKYRFV